MIMNPENQVGKPPLVARSDRLSRHRFLPRLQRSLINTLLILFPSYRIKFKWRWCRGEIRSRHLFIAWVRNHITPPIRQLLYPTALGRRAFIVEHLPDGDLPIYGESDKK